jgi:hypothetical protein
VTLSPKREVISRSNRCQNEAPVHAKNMLEFEVDRLSRVGDTGRRKFSSCFNCVQRTCNFFLASDALKHGLHGLAPE